MPWLFAFGKGRRAFNPVKACATYIDEEADAVWHLSAAVSTLISQVNARLRHCYS